MSDMFQAMGLEVPGNGYIAFPQMQDRASGDMKDPSKTERCETNSS